MKAWPFSLSVLFLTTLSLAQDAGPYAGKWSGELVNEKGRSFGLQVELTPDGKGSWVTTARNRNDPCSGLKSPIAVSSAGADELDFKVKMGEVVGGCPTFRVLLKKVDDKTLTGKRGNDAVKLVRQ